MNSEKGKFKLTVEHGITGYVRKLCGATIAACGAAALLLAAAASSTLAATPVEVTGFAPNPGSLRMFRYIPDALPASAPLVVVMHGCTQNARAYAEESGWMALADQLKMAL